MADQTSRLIGQVKAAHENGQALCIQGGGSKNFHGRLPEGGLLSLADHTGIISYDPAELVLKARSGTPLAEIEAALQEHGQALSFEPPHFGGQATIGGTLACNLSGPARPWSGSGRDMLLGVKLINGRGDLLTFGGQVMKNVAGYDVSRLQCGALGCLGILSEVSLKVLPCKPARLCLRANSVKADRAIALMNTLCVMTLPISGAVWLDGSLHLRMEAGKISPDDIMAMIRDVADDLHFQEGSADFWGRVRDQTHAFFQSNEPLWRFSIKATARHFRQEASWLIDWAGSQRWLRGSFNQAQLEHEARAGGGTVACFRHGDRTREVFQDPDPVTRRLLSNLKTVFDPHKVFNPGRLYSWL